MSDTNNKEEDEVAARVVCMVANGLAPVPGSRIEECYKCHADVFVSPSTLLSLQGATYEPVCVNCFAAEMRAGAEYEIAPIHATQVAEVQKYTNQGSILHSIAQQPDGLDKLVEVSMQAIKEGKLYGTTPGGTTE